MIRTVDFAVVKKMLHSVVVTLARTPAVAPFKNREHSSGYFSLDFQDTLTLSEPITLRRFRHLNILLQLYRSILRVFAPLM